jgi:hypothetical protein
VWKPSCRKAVPHGFEHLLAGWEYAQKRECATINEDLPVDKYFEFPVVATLHVHFGLQVPANPSRHPDGMEA